MMSLKNRGIFQLMKKETQSTIAREDWISEWGMLKKRVA
jgi:hypothetical protein